jgi:hypothetical protein
VGGEWRRGETQRGEREGRKKNSKNLMKEKKEKS